MSATLTPTWEEFKQIAADFLKAADDANEDELEAGKKCVALAYLGIQWNDKDPMHAIHQQAGAPAVMRIVLKKYMSRLIQIESKATKEQA